MKNLYEIYLSLGSNIYPEQHLIQAIDLLKQHIKILAISTAWETPAVGTAGPNFINIVIRATTEHSRTVLRYGVFRKIESQLGRLRTEDKNAARTIDIDLLIYDGKIVDEDIWYMAYLALPLSELFPELTKPGSNLTIARLSEENKFSKNAICRPDVISLKMLTADYS